jgi:hypothetical protein
MKLTHPSIKFRVLARLIFIIIGMLVILGPVPATRGFQTGSGQSGPGQQRRPRVRNVPAGPILSTGRVFVEGALLANGKVLLPGGDDIASTMTLTELYDPATDTVTTTGSLATARGLNATTLLENGKVLVTGGFTTGSPPVNSAELYNPATGTWSSAGTMSVARMWHRAVRLPNGKVLVVGGDNGTTAHATCELYDPATGSWSSTGALNTARTNMDIALLSDGKVLAISGATSTGGISPTASCEIYDPATGTWTVTSPIPANRRNHKATRLANGKVLVTGGLDSSNNPSGSAYLYDPVAGTWTTATSLTDARQYHTATLLSDGRVAVVGGQGVAWLSSVEIYDPVAGTWSAGPSLAYARMLHAAVLLANGRLLIAGGFDPTSTPQFPVSVEILDLMAPVVVTGTGSSSATGGRVQPGGVFTITITLNNSLGTPFLTNYTATLPNGVTPVPGSCSGGSGSCQVTASGPSGSANDIFLTSEENRIAAVQSGGTVSWTGLIPGNGSVTIQFQAQIGSSATNGTQYCVTSTVGGVAGSQVCLTVTAILPGPGIGTTAAGLPGQQRPGSVLIYNLYTSGINPVTNDTRITLTNTNPVERANVHLFFVDGSNCAVADQFVALTQNQTMSIQASDIDPGVTGYIIAVATDESGCPMVRNDLIGESFVRFESGHLANLPALSVAAVGIPNCSPNSATTTLAFDGVTYNPLPRTLALDSLESRSTGNTTMIVVNRMGGDLTTGASALGQLAGLLFDDREASQSFTLPGGTCQMRGILGNNFPRTAPRYDAVIPAGRTGWMKLWPVEDAGITGVLINEATVGFSQGHNLHALTTTSSVVFTIPVFPAR